MLGNVGRKKFLNSYLGAPVREEEQTTTTVNNTNKANVASQNIKTSMNTEINNASS